MRTQDSIIGQSTALAAALDRLSELAAINRPVLIVGERGTGKELAAERLHFLSPRWDKPYLTLNCAALSDALLESELFGHEAGAFTGAIQRHIGRFERASEGTLFLDEIASASSRVQEKLLRIIEYGTFERLGGSETLTVSTRVVAAANVDLPDKARDGEFRADLLDRLAFDVITLPPLRKRWEDIPILAMHFGQLMTAELGHDRFPGFGMNAMRQLMAHDWPGNIRELKNATYRHLTGDEADELIDQVQIDPFESPWRLGGPAEKTPGADSAPAAQDPTDFKARTEAFEKRLVEGALKACEGHQGEAADHLSLSYHQLRNLLRKHEINAHAFKPG